MSTGSQTIAISTYLRPTMSCFSSSPSTSSKGNTSLNGTWLISMQRLLLLTPARFGTCLSFVASSLLISAAFQPARANILYDSTPLQTLHVDSRANVFSVGQSKVFSTSLDSGIWHKFSVTGEWTPDYKSDVYTPLESYQVDPTLLLRNSQVPWRVDAKFITLDSWSNASDYPWGYDDFGLFSSILGGDDDNFWGSYSPTHAYEYEFIGNGSPVDFYVKDVNFSDNFGGYTVQVYRQADGTPTSVPAPLPMVGVGAAFGFSRRLRQRVKVASLR